MIWVVDWIARYISRRVTNISFWSAAFMLVQSSNSPFWFQKIRKDSLCWRFSLISQPLCLTTYKKCTEKWEFDHFHTCISCFCSSTLSIPVTFEVFLRVTSTSPLASTSLYPSSDSLYRFQLFNAVTSSSCRCLQSCDTSFDRDSSLVTFACTKSNAPSFCRRSLPSEMACSICVWCDSRDCKMS